jgi:glycosyltransferase involved in cell wall biosynthesis
MKLKSVMMVSTNYPHPRARQRGVFVESLVRDLQAQGVKCSIIAPRRISQFINDKKNSKSENKVAGIKILYPVYFALSNIFKKISRKSLTQQVLNSFKFIDRPDIVIGKFLLTGGLCAYKIKKEYGIKAFADLGESILLKSLSKDDKDLAKEIVQNLDGFFVVSPRLREELIEIGASSEKIFLVPNQVDTQRFFRIDKLFSRKILELPIDKFLVIFVGNFIHRKGPDRVLNAISLLEDDVMGIFIGSGDIELESSKVLFKGPVDNSELVYWLNASDVFVLPTLAEGHCNAINEALACGIPIVSSKITDIEWQVGHDQGLLVDPNDIREIANAIKLIQQNPPKSKDQQIIIHSRGKKILDILNTYA